MNALNRIVGGLHALRLALSSRIPTDFNWWVTYTETEIVAGWSWKADTSALQDEICAQSFAALLVEWQEIDWSAQMRLARENSSFLPLSRSKV
jgi:hypothetical protein